MIPTYGFLDSTDRVATLKRQRLARIAARRDRRGWLRRAFLAFVLLTASLPFFVYLSPPAAPLLLAMIVVIESAQIIAIARTLLCGLRETAVERINGGWDTLVMTGMTGSQIVRGKWWAVVQSMMPEWAFLAVARGGIALGAAETIYTMRLGQCMRVLPGTMCYVGRDVPYLRPELVMIVLALIGLMLISLAMLSFVAAVGVFAALLPTRNHVVMAMVAIALCLLVAGVGAAAGSPWSRARLNDGPLSARASICNRLYSNESSGLYYYHVSRCQTAFSDLERVIDVSQLAATAFADGGVLVAADTVRPISFYPISLALHSLMVVGMVLLGFKLLTWIILSAAQRLAGYHGALSISRADYAMQVR